MHTRMCACSTATHTHTRRFQQWKSFFFLCFSSQISLPASLSLSHIRTHLHVPHLQHASRHFILPRSFCAPKSDSISASGFFELLSAQKKHYSFKDNRYLFSAQSRLISPPFAPFVPFFSSFSSYMSSSAFFCSLLT